MHQNLQTSFSLQAKNSWQTILASKAYGTFFSLHARFKYHENSRNPKACDLYIQNFSGRITIGIESIEKKIELIHDPLIGKPCFVMFVKLKGLYANDSLSNMPLELTNNLVNFPVNQFTPEYPLKVEIIYADLPGFNKNNLKESTIVDSNFERDGENLLQTKYTLPIGGKSKLELYKAYFNDENLEIIDNKSMISIRTLRNRKTREDCIGIVKSKGKSYSVVDPYPCYLSYVNFI